MLAIPPDKLAYIIAKAREYDAEVPADPDLASGSDPADDGARAILFDTPDNPTEQELRDAIDGLNLSERIELLALTWLGRGDYDAASWVDALREAERAVSEVESEYLLGTPLLGDYLAEGAAALGVSLEDYQRG